MGHFWSRQKPSETADEGTQLPPINLYDGLTLKRILDDAAARVVLEAGYPDDLSISNWKLGLGVLACLFALVAHVFPGPFPTNRTALALCCIGYFACSFGLTLLSMAKERDCILLTGPKRSTAGPTKYGVDAGVGLRLRSRLPRYSETYSLVLEPNDGHGWHMPSLNPLRLLGISSGGDAGPLEPGAPFRLEKRVGSVFDAGGGFCEVEFEAEVAKLLAAFESKKAA
eukprot:tig00000944_g5965.t1